eukprot:TRINITY_DN89418_c0_g1_i1.p1 TRINITY_DN89418_c0_g1~~TRINITY_DN89418_c0_g1_i1.p1  ORF type:complete len:490 (-),score=67.87 TRINITY_DN89418_c0_g1_i1:298-1767(-)
MALGGLCPPAGFCTLRRMSASVIKQETSSAQLVEVCLNRIRQAPAHSSCSFVQVYGSEAQASAADLDAKLRSSIETTRHGPLTGIPVAVKDLLDVAGQPTWGGRPPSENEAMASEDAIVVSRLKAAGAIVLGKTHLTELACVGHGYNHHYKAPTSPFKRSESGDGYLPGGSSSGSAVAVADGLVPVALGTDTGGSIRIPAAWCGVVGFKPSFGRVPLRGCQPLGNVSLDTIGPIGRCVEDCAVVFRVLADIAEPSKPSECPQIAKMRFIIPAYCLENLDTEVEGSFEAAVSAIEQAGATVHRLGTLDPILKELQDLMTVTFHTEAAASLQHFLKDERGKSLGFVVRSRIEQGSKTSAVEYLHAQQRRHLLCAEIDAMTKSYDGVLMPTVRCAPILLSEAQASDEALQQAAHKCSLNTRLGNLLGRCAASLPCNRSDIPVGIMVMGEKGGDEYCLDVAMAIEAVLSACGLGVDSRQRSDSHAKRRRIMGA